METQTDTSNANTNVERDGGEGVHDVAQDETQADDVFNEAEEIGGLGKRKTRSPCWSHFERKIVNGLLKAECNYCHKMLGAKSSNGTKHLNDHFHRCLKRPYKDIRQHILVREQKKADGSPSSFLSNYSFNADASRRNLAEMIIIVHEYPLAMVDHHAFRKFVGGLQPLFKVPSRNTIKSDISKIYDYQKQKTLKLLGKIRVGLQ